MSAPEVARTSKEDLVAELEAAAAKWVLEKSKYTLESLRDARRAVLKQMQAHGIETRALCEHYWGDHDRRCQRPSGHVGEHLFLMPGYAIDIDAYGKPPSENGGGSQP